MFNLDNFKLMLVKHKYTTNLLAKRLGISQSSLYRRLNDSGNFSMKEVRVMVALFGKEDVFNALFC